MSGGTEGIEREPGRGGRIAESFGVPGAELSSCCCCCVACHSRYWEGVPRKPTLPYAPRWMTWVAESMHLWS